MITSLEVKEAYALVERMERMQIAEMIVFPLDTTYCTWSLVKRIMKDEIPSFYVEEYRKVPRLFFGTKSTGVPRSIVRWR